jgi:DNA repair protein RAD50
MAHLSAGASGKTLDDAINQVLEAEGDIDEAEAKRDKLADRLKQGADEIALVRARAAVSLFAPHSLRRTQIERNVASLRDTVARTKTRGERLAALERERAELEAKKEMLEAEIAEAERSQATARKEKADAEAVRDRMREEHAAREQEVDTALRTLLRDMDRVTDQTNAIKAFITERKGEQLVTAKAGVTDAQERVNEGEAALKQLSDSVRALDDEVRSTAEIRRVLDDNVAYRQGVAAADALAEQMRQQGAERDALGDYASLRRESDKLKAKAQDFRNDQNVARGRTSTYKEHVDKCKRELKDASFKDIDERFRKATIELRTTEMANDDLNKYYNALDKALMAFHAAKMAEINKVIKELWQKTYRNQDIDHIFICSDAEATTGRSYNYRVVMKNGDAELDMRGRCSAGQRVLACLIIRLALAETFCLNCGILALDEPTTNLDARNSTSLAQALTDIMQSRRDQENFQLIVITHDVRFAHLIGQREHAEYYWRISKDEEMHSHIEKARLKLACVLPSENWRSRNLCCATQEDILE